MSANKIVHGFSGRTYKAAQSWFTPKQITVAGVTGGMHQQVHNSTQEHEFQSKQSDEEHEDNTVEDKDSSGPTTLRQSGAFPHTLPSCTNTIEKMLSLLHLAHRIHAIRDPLIAGSSLTKHLKWSRPSSTITSTPSSAELAWVQLHQHAPTSVGIVDATNQYHELIASNSRLPTYGRKRFESVFDYTSTMRLSLAQRIGYHAPNILGDITLDGVRYAKAGDACANITIHLEQDLSGKAVAYDDHTKVTKEIVFKVLELRAQEKQLAL
ncbi:hypothetical protein LTR82_018102 [Friedmanniomyces endolithicus]|uniref:Uncharacterized protein n=1 Tax=Friedmanniomyces endolithicus TaxID=329885 RepID=A0AAN6F4G5_9PEZI|nr:hypothetical protein LTR82_018102 [Friedmanniomyces endolithicus]